VVIGWLWEVIVIFGGDHGFVLSPGFDPLVVVPDRDIGRWYIREQATAVLACSGFIPAWFSGSRYMTSVLRERWD
jgi:hypothetical protein